MEQISNEIQVGHADIGLNGLLGSIGDEQRAYERRFSQSEDFFLHLPEPLSIPHFQIHHDVRQAEPSPEYVADLLAVTEQVARKAPQVLKGLTYFFDPAEILRPGFYHLYRIGERLFLYLLRIDLMMRANGKHGDRARHQRHDPGVFHPPSLPGGVYHPAGGSDPAGKQGEGVPRQADDLPDMDRASSAGATSSRVSGWTPT